MLQHSILLKYLQHTNVQALKFVRVLHLSAVRRLVDILEQEDCDASLMSTASTVSTLTSNTSSVGFLVELETKDMQRFAKISQSRRRSLIGAFSVITNLRVDLPFKL